jgi:hypothetical protein
MQRFRTAGDTHGAVEEATLLEPIGRGVDLLGMKYWKFRQKGITVMAVGVEGILAVGRILPYRIGKKFVLRLSRPIAMLFRPSGIFANHLLQEDDVGVNRADRFAKAVQDEPSIVPGKAFVNIDGYYAQFPHAD